MCLAITCHYIDDNFNLHQPLLSFQHLEERHSGPYLARIVLDVLNEYDLCDKLFCITTDNAKNNDTMVRTLETLLEKDGVSWDSTANHIRCLTHVINLVVTSYLDNLKINGLSITTTLDKLRTIAKAIRSSSSRTWRVPILCRLRRRYSANFARRKLENSQRIAGRCRGGSCPRFRP